MRRRSKIRAHEARVLGIAWHRQEQWDRVLQTAEDADEMHSSYAEWEASAEESFSFMVAQGLAVRKVDYDLDQFLLWCRVKRVPVNGPSRSSFIAEKLHESNTLGR